MRVLRVGEDESEERAELRVGPGERVTQLALSRTEGLVAATDKGLLYYWELDSGFRLAPRPQPRPATRPITALGGQLSAASRCWWATSAGAWRPGSACG